MRRPRPFTVLFFAASLLACGASSDQAEEGGAEGGSAGDEGTAASEEAAVIRVRDLGEIRIRFFPELAPGHVENFKKLTREGFYDGTTFHRVIPGFMIQGGDPNSKDDDPSNDGFGGPGFNLKAEFSQKPHVRGIVSMARGPQPDTAGSQFFIVVKDANMLDGKYTVFGEVSEGMDVADKIVAVNRDPRDRPLENVVMESVRIE